MTTTQRTCHIATCDECTNPYETDDGITLHYDSAAEAIAEAESCDWQSLTDGRLICDRCVKTLLERGEIETDPNDEAAYRLVTAAALTA